MSSKRIAAIVLGLIATSAYADNSYPTPIKEGMPGHKHGDIIAPMTDEQIAAWCDFNKQIVMTKTKVLCAYVGGKSPQEPSLSSASNNKAPAKFFAKKEHFPAVPKDLNPTLYEMSEYENT